MPERLQPMLARSGPLPPDDGRWAYEIKWDGVRAVAFVRDGALRLCSRTCRDITTQYPEVAGLAAELAGTAAVLDGEIVAFEDGARPSFQKLQRRMHVASPMAAVALARDAPVHYLVFDLLWIEGESLMGRPYLERREALAALGLGGAAWHVPGHHLGDGAALQALSRERGLEGIVAKRIDCPYTPGRRSAGWVKVKNTRRASLVIGGWLPGEGGRSGRIGALAVGYHEDGALRYAGKVGTGFTQSELDRLAGILAPLARPTSPFAGPGPARTARYVEPALVCDVEFVEWTNARTLRAPSYKGLRDDVDPAGVAFDPGT